MINLLLALVSGAALIAVFPNFGLYFLAYAAVAPLLIAIKRSRSVLEASLLGLLCGVIYFGGTLYWINILSKWAGAWAYLAWISLVIFQAIFLCLFAALFKYSQIKLPGFSLLFAPAIWAMVEWIRSLGPYGVTGGGLSYSQAEVLPVLQLARLAGPYGISFLIVLINQAIAEAISDKKWKPAAGAALLFIAIYICGYYRISSFRETGKPVELAVIQGNISQDVKLDYGLAYEIVDIQEGMSRTAASLKPQIVIWPETAVTTYLFETQKIRSSIEKLVRETGAYYLIGTPYREKDKIYNSVVAFSKKGDLIGRYDKQRLVPFGEYLPLRPLFFHLLQDNPLFAEDYNGDPGPRVIDLGIAKVGVVICFESTLPYLVRDRVKRGAQFILVATNDAWFFDSAALRQHIQAARMRAVENGVYVVQAANTGISAFIDPLGRIVKSSSIEQPTILTGTVYIH